MLIQQIEQIFSQLGWQYTREEYQVRTRYLCNGGQINLTVMEHRLLDLQYLVIMSRLPVLVAPERRVMFNEFLVRINTGSVIGIDLDYASGMVFVKSVIPCAAQLTTEMLRQVLIVNLNAVERVLPWLMAVLYGNLPPEEAARKVTAMQDFFDPDLERLPARLRGFIPLYPELTYFSDN